MPSLHRQPGSSYSSPYSGMQDWVEVSGRGVGSLFGLSLLGLMIWGFGVSVVKSVVVVLASIASTSGVTIGASAGAPLLWAVGEGTLIGALVLVLRRQWYAYKRRGWGADRAKTVMPQVAPCFFAGVAVAVAALAVNVGALPNFMAGAELDLSIGIPGLLDSANMFSGSGGGPGGGDGPTIDIAGSMGILWALLLILIIGGSIVSGIAGGGLGAVGLGALGGAAEGALSEGHSAARAGAFASALSGAASGAVAGAVSGAISIHLTCVLAGVTGDRWGPVILVDLVATIFAATLILLCRTSWDNPTGLLGNTIEAAKVILVLFQYALALTIALAVLGAGVFAFKWIFN